MQLSPPNVLTIAASDPTGGAGIQADIMTIASCGCHALSVITALTVQDTRGIESMRPIEAGWVEAQARALLADMAVSVFKIGLTGSLENIEVIAGILSDYPDIPVVLDPVLASGRGDALADEDMISALIKWLLPLTDILTPNSLEARKLIDQSFKENSGTEWSLAEYAERLIALGCDHVLLTGTHEDTPQVVNDLYSKDGLLCSDRWERLPDSYHGSGCTLASAVAAHLAHGLPISDAVHEAQNYTWQTLKAGFRAGRGQFIPNRFFRSRHGE
ncbi:MAG: bifunctional hydroxymethylpyrimidine kinase/phosphomethylpyrimidine kinase [Propionivibrio sp.]|nr:bifunctional hydroxymethylpyrimidine kinase/phosphomethylpyrimidine kinase [Propionivibrio sp.]